MEKSGRTLLAKDLGPACHRTSWRGYRSAPCRSSLAARPRRLARSARSQETQSFRAQSRTDLRDAGPRDFDRAWTRRHHQDRPGTAGGVAGRNGGRRHWSCSMSIKPGQGIVHVIGPELGLSLPGSLIVCGDSHTCTHGGLGALAFGIGSSELTHVLATQALIQRRPKTMRVGFEGKLSAGRDREGHDPCLDRPCRCRRRHRICRRIRRQRDRGFAGRRVGSLICNLSIELGAKMGMVAPDEKTYDVHPGEGATPPQGGMWEQAVPGLAGGCPATPMRCRQGKFELMSRTLFRR